MFAPIPKCVLSQDAVVYEPSKTSDYSGEFEADGMYIAHVLYQSKKQLGRNAVKLSDGSQGLLFVDAVNSMGAYSVPVGSKVAIDGEERIVVSVMPCLTYNGNIHHWELELK